MFCHGCYCPCACFADCVVLPTLLFFCCLFLRLLIFLVVLVAVIMVVLVFLFLLLCMLLTFSTWKLGQNYVMLLTVKNNLSSSDSRSREAKDGQVSISDLASPQQSFAMFPRS